MVLDILAQKGVKATFFIVGSVGAVNRDLLQRIYREGHDIGNHTFTHLQLWPTFRNEHFSLELNATQRLLESTLGVRTKLFRPPFGGDLEPQTIDGAEALRAGLSARLSHDRHEHRSQGLGPSSARQIVAKTRRGRAEGRRQRRPAARRRRHARRHRRGAAPDYRPLAGGGLPLRCHPRAARPHARSGDAAGRAGGRADRCAQLCEFQPVQRLQLGDRLPLPARHSARHAAHAVGGNLRRRSRAPGKEALELDLDAQVVCGRHSGPQRGEGDLRFHSGAAGHSDRQLQDHCSR